MLTETTTPSEPLDLPEPWATQLRDLAKEIGVDPDVLLSRFVAEQLELRQAGRRLCVPTLFSPPKG